jgi:hypothetical protein
MICRDGLELGDTFSSNPYILDLSNGIMVRTISVLLVPLLIVTLAVMVQRAQADPNFDQGASGVSDTIKVLTSGIASTIVPSHIINDAKSMHRPQQPYVRILIANQTSSLDSQRYTEVKFRIPVNITNVRFSIAAEVVGDNFTGTPGVNVQLYDISECHKTIIATDLQPDGRCGISYLDDTGMSAMNGSFGGLRLPNDRDYILILTNPADGPVQIKRSAFFTFTYMNSTLGEAK